MSAYTLSPQRLLAIGAFAVTFAGGQLKAQANSSSQLSPDAQITHANGVTVLNVQNRASAAAVDFVHAKPMPLPVNNSVPDGAEALLQAMAAAPLAGPSGYSAGVAGEGKTNPAFLGKPEIAANDEVAPADFGTNNHPFSTSRADLYNEVTNTSYPYSAAGKLFFNEPGSGSYLCSASMIKRGIVVTAAHCVARYGAEQFYNSWQFVPGYRSGWAPFGVWTVRQAWILTSYYNGTDNCAVYGVVCPDDVAVLILNTQNGGYAGTNTGWFGYWYGGGFTSGGLTEITQLGYPVGLNNGLYMERDDSYGYRSPSNSNNTIIGTNMNGGSSGGPWVVNFGLPYVLTGETNGGGYSFVNAIVGVTSWGYTSTSPKEAGAAPFTSGNIQTLLNVACGATPGACS